MVMWTMLWTIAVVIGSNFWITYKGTPFQLVFFHQVWEHYRIPSLFCERPISKVQKFPTTRIDKYKILSINDFLGGKYSPILGHFGRNIFEKKHSVNIPFFSDMHCDQNPKNGDNFKKIKNCLQLPTMWKGA
jgi:hypothetical protein